MLHTHFYSIGQPGSYEEVRNRTLKCIKLPEIKISGDPPSRKVLDMAFKEEEMENDHDQTQDKESEVNTTKEHTTTNNSKKLKGKEIGLAIITPGS